MFASPDSGSSSATRTGPLPNVLPEAVGSIPEPGPVEPGPKLRLPAEHPAMNVAASTPRPSSLNPPAILTCPTFIKSRTLSPTAPSLE